MPLSDRRRALAVLAVVALPPAAVLACNQLTGISDFTKIDCSAGQCPDGSSPVSGEAGTDADTGGTGAPETSLPEVSVDARPTPDVTLRWARWPMPNPPDAGVDAYTASYASDDAGSVTDNKTMLVWTLQTWTAASFDEAFARCASLMNGWRLPTRIELASLIDWTQTPTIDPTAFPDASGGPYWTWSDVAGTDGGAYWNVDFDQGLVTSQNTPQTRSVRCVKR
jgi:hypothetical protein